jgi:tyrosyl-tRNA synthetase
MLQQGAVKVAGEKVADLELPRAALAGQVVQVGKRRFIRFSD